MNTVEIRRDSQADGPEAGFAGSGGGINETRRAGDGEKARIRRLEVPVGPGGVDGPFEVENDLINVAAQDTVQGRVVLRRIS